MVPQSLEQHFQALFTREFWTKAGKSVQCTNRTQIVTLMVGQLDKYYTMLYYSIPSDNAGQ